MSRQQVRSGADGGSPVGGTVAARSELPAARVLAESYLRHHPTHSFVVIAIDGAQQQDTPYQVKEPGWLGVDRTDLLRFATSFPEDELAQRLAPMLLRRLLDEHDTAVYLDSCSQVLAPLDDLVDVARGQGVTLLPHLLQPAPEDRYQPGQRAFAAAGQYDLGLLAVSRGATDFLDFWAERATRATSPGWRDQLPTLFDHHVVRDPGLGLSYRNAHERPLVEQPDGSVTAAGVPLRHLHFRGYQPELPWLLSAETDQPRVKLSEHPVLRTLCDEYRKLCLDAGEHEVSRFARLPDGTPLTQTMRELFRAQWLASERPAEHHETFAPAPAIPPHPFGPDHGLAFRYWMTSAISPHEAAAGMNRLVMHLWRSRVDLQVAFPAPTGASADGFRHWCRTHGLANGALPAWALPADPVPPEPPEDAFGVNLVGYLTAELGLGEMGRIVHHVAEDAAIPVASVTDAHSVRCQTVLDEPHTSGPPRYPVSILAVNSDFTESLLSTFPDVGHDRYRIGLWAWELTDFPPRMHSGFGALDEVWTVSDFTRAAVAAHSPVPVKTFPVPVLDPGAVSRSATRRPEDPVRFFFAFDYNSTGQRKNPWGLVRAFQQAFPDRPDARLVIKAGNGVGHPAAVERLRHTIGSDGRIQLIERYLTADELQKQYAGCDAYVSLHRSEGFGLTVAEAMARGIPVIATDYSATTEFFDDSVGWTVPYRLVPVGPGWEPYQADGHWAEPDLDAAARAMRAVAEHPELALRRGAAARERILRDRSVATAAEWVRAQVTDAYRMWRSRSHEDRSATAAIDKAAAALHWRADPGTARANPMAPALRRLVLRAIDHYDAHQRLVQEALLDGVREAIEQLTRESTEFGEAHAAGMREVAARLDAVEQELRNPDTRG